MALYPYKCGGCGKEETVHQSISSYCKAPNIPVCDCGKAMARLITVPMVKPDEIQPFQSTVDGSWITSKSQQRDHMAEHGVIFYDEAVQHAAKSKANREQANKTRLKQDVIDSVFKAEAGHRPHVIPESDLIPKD